MEALVALQRLGAVRVERPRAVGAGRGQPVLASHALRWKDVDIDIDTFVDRTQTAEATLTLPSWDELVSSSWCEDDVWELFDTFADATSTRAAVISDGEASHPQLLDRSLDAALDVDLELVLRRHVGLLVRAGVTVQVPPLLGVVYRVLPRSNLAVILH
jgi:hypothetical protein